MDAELPLSEGGYALHSVFDAFKVLSPLVGIKICHGRKKYSRMEFPAHICANLTRSR